MVSSSSSSSSGCSSFFSLSLWTIEIWAAAAYTYRGRALRSVTLVPARRGAAQSRPIWLGVECAVQPRAAAAATAAAERGKEERRFVFGNLI